MNNFELPKGEAFSLNVMKCLISMKYGSEKYKIMCCVGSGDKDVNSECCHWSFAKMD